MTDTSASFSFPNAAERRAFRDELGRGIGRYIPPELRPLLGLVAESTPSAALERAGAASADVVAPDRTAMERLGSLGTALSETAGVAAPMLAAPRAAIPASEALQDALLGASVGARSAGQGFVERMNQPGEVPVMYSGFDPDAVIRALREGVPDAEARLAEDMRIGNERIRAESLARMGAAPSITPPARYAEFLSDRGFTEDFQDLMLGRAGNQFDAVRQIFDEDSDFALDALRSVAGEGASPAQLASTRDQVTRLTQELLQDFPEEVTVYRAGRVIPGQPQSFTLDPNYDVSGNLPWREGSDNPLVAYTVRKSDILASPDITRRGAIGEGEVIIRGEDVSRPADPGSPTPFLYGANSREEELRELLRRIDARERASLNAAAQRDIDRAGSSTNTPQDFGFFQDNPALSRGDTDWLRGKQEAAEASYDERRGITGSTTAMLGANEQDMFLPTRFLRRIPGLNNENPVPGTAKYDALMRDVQEQGFLSDQAGNRIVLGVNHRGEPFLIEGNNRTAVAADLGIPSVRVEVRYKNGGEMVDGPFSPENISRIADRGPEGFARGGEVKNGIGTLNREARDMFRKDDDMMRGNMSKQLEGGIGGLNERARGMYRGPRGIEGFAQYMQEGGEVLPTTGVGRGPMQGSTIGMPVSGSAAGRDESADQERLARIRRRVIEESGVDPLRVAMDEGVDPDLFLRLIAQESSGDARAESDAGAYGYTQLMEGTARELGVDRTDPEQNLRGGARYLRQQLDRFQEVPLALAAYNAGPGAVERFGGIPPYAETRTYVARILGNQGGQMGISPGRRPEPVVPMMRPDPALASAPAPTMRPDILPAMDPMTAYRVEQQQALAQQMANAPEVASSAPRQQMTPEQMRMQLPREDRGFIDLMRNFP